MAVDVALDGGDALGHLDANRYDVRSARTATFPACTATTCAGPWPTRESGTRVLMLTAAGSVADRVEGLGLGADDYLPKPFDFAELVGPRPCPGAASRRAAARHARARRPECGPGPPGRGPRGTGGCR